jgi:hypothetical protein
MGGEHLCWRFTCSRTGRRGAWCCPCGSRAASCTCRDPVARSPDGSCPCASLSSRPASAPGPASEPAEIQNFKYRKKISNEAIYLYIGKLNILFFLFDLNNLIKLTILLNNRKY